MQIQSWSILGQSFHFGLHGMGQEKTSPTFPSDSLFAALVARLALGAQESSVQAFCQPFIQGKPPFLLTSTFPLAGGVRFFPPPLTAFRSGGKAGAGKSIKGVLFVSEMLYRLLLENNLLEDLDGVHPLQGGKLWVSRDELEHLPGSLHIPGASLWEEHQRPRVTLDRASQASTLFFTGQVTHAGECGLWFGLRWLQDDPGLREQVADLLADLAEAGLGAERSSGLGAARIAPLGDFELPEPTGCWTTLSRYLPTRKEVAALTSPLAAYAIRRVGGWLDSASGPGQRRRAVNLLVEGSVFGNLPGAAPGQVADVRPTYAGNPDPLGHPVYRSGLAFPVGMKAGAS